MDTRLWIIFIALGVAAACGVALFFYLFAPKGQANMRALMGGAGTARPLRSVRSTREALENDLSGEELDKVKRLTKSVKSKKKELSFEEKFFQAGIFSDRDKGNFRNLRLIAPAIVIPIGIVLGAKIGVGALALGVIGLSVYLGYKLPFYILDRKIKLRHEEIMYYLPLVIEQVAIGVSSSLDVGPCLQRIVSMADERDTHNVVTELVRHAHFYVKSGASLEDALLEVGKLSGHTELKHSFMALSQVAKHGGEITKQLQELAEAVSGQREASVEEKIKKLELEATVPVAIVFVGFVLIFISGFAIQIKEAF